MWCGRRKGSGCQVDLSCELFPPAHAFDSGRAVGFGRYLAAGAEESTTVDHFTNISCLSAPRLVHTKRDGQLATLAPSRGQRACTRLLHPFLIYFRFSLYHFSLPCGHRCTHTGTRYTVANVAECNVYGVLLVQEVKAVPWLCSGTAS